VDCVFTVLAMKFPEYFDEPLMAGSQ
jgi:hypothetical protein